MFAVYEEAEQNIQNATGPIDDGYITNVVGALPGDALCCSGPEALDDGMPHMLFCGPNGHTCFLHIVHFNTCVECSLGCVALMFCPHAVGSMPLVVAGVLSSADLAQCTEQAINVESRQMCPHIVSWCL